MGNKKSSVSIEKGKNSTCIMRQKKYLSKKEKLQIEKLFIKKSILINFKAIYVIYF